MILNIGFQINMASSCIEYIMKLLFPVVALIFCIVGCVLWYRADSAPLLSCICYNEEHKYICGKHQITLSNINCTFNEEIYVCSSDMYQRTASFGCDDYSYRIFAWFGVAIFIGYGLIVLCCKYGFCTMNPPTPNLLLPSTTTTHTYRNACTSSPCVYLDVHSDVHSAFPPKYNTLDVPPPYI